MSITLIPGNEVLLGRRKYIIPPAPFACVEKHEDVFMGREKNPKPSVIFDILYMSLLRNYPELSRDELAMDVDIKNMNIALVSAMQVNSSGEQSGE